MSEGFDNELISAMLDGELSAEQQAMVDAHLAESGSARTEAAQLEALSKLISDVPVEAAPKQLAQQVMSGVIRSKPEPVPSEPASKTNVSTPFWKRHWRGIASMATAAAALFLMFRGSSPEPAMESRTADASSAPAAQLVVEDREMESGESPAMAAELSETLQAGIMNDMPNTGVAMIRVAPDAEELLKRYLNAQDLEHKYAPMNAVLKEEGLDAIVVSASRDDIRALLVRVEEESGPGSLEWNRDTDPNSLNKRLMAAISLSPPEMTIAGNVARLAPAAPASAFGGGFGGAGFGSGAESALAGDAVGGGRGAQPARKRVGAVPEGRRAMRAAPAAPGARKPARIVSKDAEGAGADDDVVAQSDSSVEQKLGPADLPDAPLDRKIAKSDNTKAKSTPRPEAAEPPVPMQVIFVVRKPPADSSTDPCTDPA